MTRTRSRPLAAGLVAPTDLGGRHGDRDGIAVLLAFEGLLEAGDQIAVTLDVGQGFTAGRAVDDGSLVVLEGVVNEYDSVCSDLHV